MRGLVSFHPVDLAFFDDLLQPMVAGEKVNPEEWLERSLRVHQAARTAGRFKEALEVLLDGLEPPPLPEAGTLWTKVRARLERMEYRPTRASVMVARAVERELHLEGRPFFITEGSADRVSIVADEYCQARDAAAAEALVLEQLVRLDKALGREVEPPEGQPGAASIHVRRELLEELRRVHDLARAAEAGDSWSVPGGSRTPATDALPVELPWRAVTLASRPLPFWVGRDVDGLETICKAAGIDTPPFLTPAWRLLGPVCERFPELKSALRTEMGRDRDVGAFVAPGDVPDLLDFLQREGSRIIRIAGQVGEAETCALLLRKIRECARYAESHGMGYLEAAGVPPHWDPERD